MKKYLFLLGMVLIVQNNSFAENCFKGDFYGQDYEVVDSGLDKYGDYTSQVIFSKSGTLKGKGVYFATQAEAYAETKFRKKNGWDAVVSVSYGLSGSFFTLCAGEDLTKSDGYSCISCVDREED